MEHHDCMNMYVVYDRLAEQAGPIFYSKNNRLAYRSYARFMAEHQNAPGRDDMVLYNVGTIDLVTMLIVQGVPERVYASETSPEELQATYLKTVGASHE